LVLVVSPWSTRIHATCAPRMPQRAAGFSRAAELADKRKPPARLPRSLPMRAAARAPHVASPVHEFRPAMPDRQAAQKGRSDPHKSIPDSVALAPRFAPGGAPTGPAFETTVSARPPRDLGEPEGAAATLRTQIAPRYTPLEEMTVTARTGERCPIGAANRSFPPRNPPTSTGGNEKRRSLIATMSGFARGYCR
jgi:hypothetical protein